MAPQFQVLRCCSCHVFQVHQVKKSKKWNCKICNEKQSVLKVFGQGSGFDCRHHVQKLNLMQGEREQTSMNSPRCIEEPMQMGNVNTVVNLEEKLDWQKKKSETVSRWTKYLDERCEEQEKGDGEEEMIPTEKQICSSMEKTAKHPRKCKKTSFCITDGQGQMEQCVSGFADNVKSFENSPDSITMYSKTCGDAPWKSVFIPAVEEHVPRRENKDPGSKGVGLSKQKAFLLSGKSGAPSGMRQQGQIPTFVAGARSERRVSSSLWNRLRPLEQTASIRGERAQRATATDEATVAHLPMESSRPVPVWPRTRPQERLLDRLPEDTNLFPSKGPLAVSNSNNLYLNLFSTDDDFDDDI
ncbi:hypothetical protein JRQ81_002575 [Phrynocephalus forsythii]|uniref:MRN complex-interacting protein N-terminal domain-containing protein n=1 Tax=Phrynocephalus forsythii TaxID=171643 RepID=A0A9Q0XI76_9SAUR|nr:hypothetical protein JRQ81_002575 [Phrynocephalus forsythii]